MSLNSCIHITLILLSQIENKRFESQGPYIHIFTLSACHLLLLPKTFKEPLHYGQSTKLVMCHISIAIHNMASFSVLTLTCQGITQFNQIPPT